MSTTLYPVIAQLAERGTVEVITIVIPRSAVQIRLAGRNFFINNSTFKILLNSISIIYIQIRHYATSHTENLVDTEFSKMSQWLFLSSRAL